MTQCTKKNVYVEKHTLKDLNALPIDIQKEFMALFKELSIYGYLSYPDGKKLSGYNLFEGRVKRDGIWRCIYSYEDGRVILILNIFRKKTRKTPVREIEKAFNRSLKY